MSSLNPIHLTADQPSRIARANELAPRRMTKPDYLRSISYRFEWDESAGYCHDIVYYGPWGQSSQSWIVPGTIEEDLPVEDDDEESL